MSEAFPGVHHIAAAARCSWRGNKVTKLEIGLRYALGDLEGLRGNKLTQSVPKEYRNTSNLRSRPSIAVGFSAIPDGSLDSAPDSDPDSGSNSDSDTDY